MPQNLNDIQREADVAFRQSFGDMLGWVMQKIDTGRRVAWGQVFPRPGFTRGQNFIYDLHGVDPRDSFTQDTMAGKQYRALQAVHQENVDNALDQFNPAIAGTQWGEMMLMKAPLESRLQTMDLITDVGVDFFNLVDPDIVHGAGILTAALYGFARPARYLRHASNMPYINTVRQISRYSKFDPAVSAGGVIGNGVRNVLTASIDPATGIFDATKRIPNQWLADMLNNHMYGIYNRFKKSVTAADIMEDVPEAQSLRAIGFDLKSMSTDPHRQSMEEWYNYVHTPINDEHKRKIVELQHKYFGQLADWDDLRYPYMVPGFAGGTPRTVSSTPSTVVIRKTKDRIIMLDSRRSGEVGRWHDLGKHPKGKMLRAYIAIKPEDRTDEMYRLMEKAVGSDFKKYKDMYMRKPNRGELVAYASNRAMTDVRSTKDYKSRVLQSIIDGKTSSLPLVPKPRQHVRYVGSSESPYRGSLAKQFINEAIEKDIIGDPSAMRELAASKASYRDLFYNPLDNDGSHLLAYLTHADNNYLYELERLKFDQSRKAGMPIVPRIHKRYPFIKFPGLEMGPVMEFDPESPQLIKFPDGNIYDRRFQTELSRMMSYSTELAGGPVPEYGAINYIDFIDSVDNYVGTRSLNVRKMKFDTQRHMIYDAESVGDKAINSLRRHIRRRLKSANVDPSNYGIVIDNALQALREEFELDFATRAGSKSSYYVSQVNKLLDDPSSISKSSKYSKRLNESEGVHMDSIRAINPSALKSLPNFSSFVAVELDRAKTMILPDRWVSKTVREITNRVKRGSTDGHVLVRNGAVVNYDSPVLSQGSRNEWGFVIPVMTPYTAETMIQSMHDIHEFQMLNDNSVFSALSSTSEMVDQSRHAAVHVVDYSLRDFMHTVPPVKSAEPSDISQSIGQAIWKDQKEYMELQHAILPTLGSTPDAKYSYRYADSYHAYEGNDQFKWAVENGFVDIDRSTILTLKPPKDGWTAQSLYDAYMQAIKDVAIRNPERLMGVSFMLSQSHSMDLDSIVNQLRSTSSMMPYYEAVVGEDPIVRNGIEYLTKKVNEAGEVTTDVLDDMNLLSNHMQSSVAASLDMHMLAMEVRNMRKLGASAEDVEGIVWDVFNNSLAKIDNFESAFNETLRQISDNVVRPEAWKYNLSDNDFTFIESLMKAYDSPLLHSPSLRSVGYDLQLDIYTAHSVLRKVRETGLPMKPEDINLLATSAEHIQELLPQFKREMLKTHMQQLRDMTKGMSADNAAQSLISYMKNRKLDPSGMIASLPIMGILKSKFTEQSTEADHQIGYQMLNKLRATGEVSTEDYTKARHYMDMIASDQEAINPIDAAMHIYMQTTADDLDQIGALRRAHGLDVYKKEHQRTLTKMSEDPYFAQQYVIDILNDYGDTGLMKGLNHIARTTGTPLEVLVKGASLFVPGSYQSMTALLGRLIQDQNWVARESK